MSEDPQLPPKLSRVDLRIAPAELRAWREEAVRAKKTLSEWIRCACDEHMERKAVAREAQARELRELKKR